MKIFCFQEGKRFLLPIYFFFLIFHPIYLDSTVVRKEITEESESYHRKLRLSFRNYLNYLRVSRREMFIYYHWYGIFQITRVLLKFGSKRTVLALRRSCKRTNTQGFPYERAMHLIPLKYLLFDISFSTKNKWDNRYHTEDLVILMYLLPPADKQHYWLYPSQS